MALIRDAIVYFGKLADSRRKKPSDDLATIIANAKSGNGQQATPKAVAVDASPLHQRTAAAAVENGGGSATRRRGLHRAGGMPALSGTSAGQAAMADGTAPRFAATKSP